MQIGAASIKLVEGEITNQSMMDRPSHFASSDFVRIWIRIPLNVNSDPHADRLAMDLHLTVGRVQHSIARAPNEYSTASAF